MKMKTCAAGVIPLCLILLSGCASDRPSQEVNLTVSGCPKITRCQLDPAGPRTNGDLLAQIEETEAAWAACAGKVDTIISCQEKDNEQAAVLTQRPE